ncbi:MAG: serine/threonine-protein kinase [Chitinophagaceae bacterium]
MATSLFKEYFKGYEILGELGRGNARVLKARSLQTGALVAIKHFAFNTDADTLRRFQRESEIMQSIAHRYIVEIIEVHLDAELPYIVMQLIEGGDLRSLLKIDGTLDMATVITLAHHMTEALSTIHAKGIVHRDVKPENIMYRRLDSGEIQFLLTDFGIARLREQADSITVTGSSMLTYDYASPEQFSQPKMVAAPTDYYSLGVVIYECLTGSVPFEYEQDDLLLHINKVISAPLPTPVMPGGYTATPAMLHLLDGLLRKQPSRRLADAASVNRLLEMATGSRTPEPQFLLSNASSQTIVYTTPAQSAPVKKRRHVSIGIALLLFIIAILFSWTSLTRHNSKILAFSPPGISAAPVIQTKQVLPPEAAHIIHTRRTPSVITGNANTASADPGVPLVNGIYYNDFDQHDSLWNTGKDDNSEFILLDGKYIMKGFNDSLSYSSFIKLNLDTDKDFTIAATATHEGTGSGDPFGIIFCGDEFRDAFFVFYITSNGYYSIGTSVRDEWNVLTDWTASANIRQDTEMNIFSIEKRDGLLRFLVNGRLEKVLSFTGGFGTYFGLRSDGAQSISFDQFIVKGSSPVINH